MFLVNIAKYWRMSFLWNNSDGCFCISTLKIDIFFLIKATLLMVARRELWNFEKQPPEVFYGKGVLRNFTKFTVKHLCQSLFFNKVAGLRPASELQNLNFQQVKFWNLIHVINNIVILPFLHKMLGVILSSSSPYKFHCSLYSPLRFLIAV